ncbi:MAG: hypothetical protein GT597_13795 [Bacteroidales bacterium]|jgi:hypothetical protein|nr:hypothetical protein [Bacteroidales bacterium]
MNKGTKSHLPEILVRMGEKRKLMKLFEVSHVTVRESLRGNVSTELGRKIRKAALERGGIETK